MTALQQCPRCKGVGVNYSSAYWNGSAQCMLCKGSGRVSGVDAQPTVPASKEQVYARAIERIRQILADDKNYQADSLKLGGIWDVCDTSADYRRGKHSEGTFVEILEKGSAVETTGNETDSPFAVGDAIIHQPFPTWPGDEGFVTGVRHTPACWHYTLDFPSKGVTSSWTPGEWLKRPGQKTSAPRCTCGEPEPALVNHGIDSLCEKCGHLIGRAP